jgi:hypothetical protein
MNRLCQINNDCSRFSWRWFDKSLFNAKMLALNPCLFICFPQAMIHGVGEPRRISANAHGLNQDDSKCLFLYGIQFDVAQ